jgi:HK97 gp10 family phage protein
MAIHIDNIGPLIQRLDKLADASKVAGAMGKCCALVERRAKQIAPKDTGQLRNSITSKVERDGNDVVGVVFTPKEYAPYVEYGTGLFAEKGGRKDVPWKYKDDEDKWHVTSGQKPHPYMRPALNENRDKILKILEESVKND